MIFKKLFDIVVIGAGPAGCLAAVAAKKQNKELNVCIVDCVDGEFRHHVGEALLTGTISTLTRAGIDAELYKQNYHKKIGAAYLWGGKKDPWYVNYPKDKKSEVGYSDLFIDKNGRHTVHVPRHKFDKFLLKQATDIGVIFLNKKIKDIIISDNSVSYAIDSDGKRLFSKRWVDCSGQAALIGKKVGVREKIRSPRSVCYGYVDDINWKQAKNMGFSKNRTNIVSNKNGWMWVIHIGNAGKNHDNDITSIGFVADPKDAKNINIKNIYNWFPELGSIFGKKDFKILDFLGESGIKEFYKCPHFSYMSKVMNGNNWSLAGDSAGFIDPILSQGVTLAAHYGFERGMAAAMSFDGVYLDDKITDSYFTEMALLNEICEMWYNDKKTSSDWKLHVQKIGDKFFDLFVEDPDSAFRLFTNLENMRGEYSSFSLCQIKEMENNLILK